MRLFGSKRAAVEAELRSENAELREAWERVAQERDAAEKAAGATLADLTVARKELADARAQGVRAVDGRERAERQLADKCRELDEAKATIRAVFDAATFCDEQARPVEDGDRGGLVRAVQAMRREAVALRAASVSLTDRLHNADLARREADELVRKLRGEAEGWAQACRKEEAARRAAESRLRLFAESVEATAQLYLGKAGWDAEETREIPLADLVRVEADGPTVADELVTGLQGYVDSLERTADQRPAGWVQVAGEPEPAPVAEASVFALLDEPGLSGVAVTEGAE